jgi:GDP-D-mannose 3',5'-epimerase
MLFVQVSLKNEKNQNKSKLDGCNRKKKGSFDFFFFFFFLSHSHTTTILFPLDWAENTYFRPEEFCSEFLLADLRKLDECIRVTKDCDWVFSLAADMGGMGFIQSNAATLFYNNLMIDVNMVEAARKNHIKRFFYSSSACVYPETMQETTSDPGLREHTAWPAQPQDAYGLEKLLAEECCKYYGIDFPQTEFRIARFHNIYGPQGTWTGGREKAPAAFCRKAAASTTDFEVWGDGLQTRSFCYIDDCVDGVLKLMASDIKEPLNIGSEEMVSSAVVVCCCCCCRL